MDKAKAAVTDFMSRSGHHDTTVHEAVAPAVTQEVIKPHVHEEVNTAIDKEVHQDHYHRTVQPVHDREVLPERHEAKIGAVQHREFDHRDADTIKRNLMADQARFKDERRIEETTHSQSVAPTVGGEHIHHHIHETIQPVVQREVIQPQVVHTTVPIHEVHHNKATFHETTALPAMTLDQFKAKGGALTGREERYDEFQGVPKNIGGGTAGGFGAVHGLEHKAGDAFSKDHARHGDYDGVANHHSHAGLRKGGLTENSTTGRRRGSSSSSSSDEGRTGHRSSRGLTGKTKNPVDRNNDGKVNAKDLTAKDRNHDGRIDAYDNVGSTGTRHGTDGALGGVDRNHDGRIDARDNVGSTGTRSGTDGVLGGGQRGDLDHRPNEDGSLPRALTEDRSRAQPHSTLHDNQHNAGQTNKPSLMDKLNPKKDANGDGQAGFMK